MRKVLAHRPLARLAFMIARGILMIYLGFTLYLIFFQRRVLYYPMRAPAEELVRIAGATGMAPWYHEDGQQIGWQPAAAMPAGADLLLVMHGNAGFALHRNYFVEGFQQIAAHPALHVFLLEYPGYGARPGKPTEPSLQAAALEAFEQIRREYPGRRIFLLGESIGSGVAAWLAGAYPTRVAGVLLITPFDRLSHVARHHYPILPVGLLLRDRFEADRALRQYPGPVGILLAGKDTVIPPEFGRALYDQIRGPKRLWVQPNRNHNTLDYNPQAVWWTEGLDFLRRHAPPAPMAL